MGLKNESVAVEDLNELEKRFIQWRRINKGKRIPSELWGEAIRLARLLGVGRVSGRLNLFYPTLKRRTQENERSGERFQQRSFSKLSFMEVPLESSAGEGKVKGDFSSRLLLQFKSRFGTVKLEWI